jgi:hypothetical protein
MSPTASAQALFAGSLKTFSCLVHDFCNLSDSINKVTVLCLKEMRHHRRVVMAHAEQWWGNDTIIDSPVVK